MYDFHDVVDYAKQIKYQLFGICNRVEITGDLRRKFHTIKKIHLLGITEDHDLLTEEVGSWAKLLVSSCLGNGFQNLVYEFGGKKFTLSLTTVTQWGACLAYSTGSDTYVAALKAKALNCGFHLREDGLVSKGFNTPANVPEESDLFNILGVYPLVPEYREGAKDAVEGAKYTVLGSQGGEYTVKNWNGNWSCNCTHFKFRKTTCRHISECGGYV